MAGAKEHPSLLVGGEPRDDAPALEQVPVYVGADPVARVSGEFHAAVRVEAVERPEEAELPLLHEVLAAKAGRVAIGDRLDQRKMEPQEAVARPGVPPVTPLAGQLSNRLGADHRGVGAELRADSLGHLLASGAHVRLSCASIAQPARPYAKLVPRFRSDWRLGVPGWKLPRSREKREEASG